METTKLKINLLIMDIYIKAGKRECNQNEYSYRGMIYRVKKVKKAPVSLEVKDKLKKRADKLNELDEQIKIGQEENRAR